MYDFGSGWNIIGSTFDSRAFRIKTTLSHSNDISSPRRCSMFDLAGKREIPRDRIATIRNGKHARDVYDFADLDPYTLRVHRALELKVEETRRSRSPVVNLSRNSTSILEGGARKRGGRGGD